MLRHAAVEAETEAFAEAGSQAQVQAQGDAVAASSPEVGSSYSRQSGSAASVRAIASRCC